MMQSAATIDSARAIVTAHQTWTTWLLIAAVILEMVAIVTLLVHRGWVWLATVPTTNLRIINGIACFTIFNGLMAITCLATQKYPPTEWVWTVEAAILIMCGLDVSQFRIKRKSTKKNLASDQNVQSGIAPAPAPTPAPVPAPPAPTPQVVQLHHFVPGD